MLLARALPLLSSYLSLLSRPQQYQVRYCREGSGECTCLMSLVPRACIADAAIISSATFFFFFFLTLSSFLLTPSIGCAAWPLLYLCIPPCSPPGPQPGVPKTDDLSTHPRPSTHPPVLTCSSPVQSSPALLCSPPLPPKAQGQPYTCAHTHLHSKSAGLFLLSTEDFHHRPPTTILSFSHSRLALHLFELLGRYGGLGTTIPLLIDCFAPTEA